MASPLSIGDCIAIIDKAIEIYGRIRDAPDQIEAVNQRMQDLKTYMSSLQRLLKSRVAALGRPETTELDNILLKIKSDVEKVKAILETWRSNQGPGGITLRFGVVKAALFALGSSPKELQDLTDNIDRRREEVNQYTTFLIAAGQSAMLNPTPSQRRPSKSPVRKEAYSIIFVDAYNKGRSVVAQAYAQLVREWTVRTNNPWRIHKNQSAGLLVEAGSETIALQRGMRMSMRPGGETPEAMALAALFDNNRFSFSNKEDIKQKTTSRTSRGLTESLFTTYDFILLFNRMDAANLERLKEALIAKNGKSATMKGMGRLRFLGDYGNSGKSEIWNPRREPDGTYSRESWNKIVSNIKFSFKEFLKKETGWVQPLPAARQD